MNGIYLNSSLSNTIRGNELHNNILHGLYLYISNNNDIQNNKLSFNGGSGLYLLQSSGGFSLPILGNHIWNNSDAGIILCSSNSNHVDFDTIYNNSHGIVFIRKFRKLIRNIDLGWCHHSFLIT